MTRKKRFIKAIILVCLVLIGCILKVNAQNKLIVRKQFFNSDWKFSLGDAIENSQSNFDDSNWRKLNVPHDWSIEGKSEKDNPSGGDGGFYPMGKAWYRKTFKIPNEWKEHKVSIYFEGVYMNSEVFINGKSVGIQPYGYTSFEYDLSPYIKFGQENVIAIKVDNSQQKNCRWYSGSGIYRNVWLMVKNLVHVKNWGVAVNTLEITKDKATLQVRTIVKNETAIQQNVILSTAIGREIDKDHAYSENKISLQPNEEKEIIQNLTVEKPKLWTIPTPNVYEVKSAIKSASKVFDVTTTSIGIRTINFSAENGFLLNGKQIKLNGGCVHHDNGALGAASYDRAEERKVELLKVAGFNAVRTSHNPPSEAFLNACDKLGLLVIDEAFDGWREQKNTYDYASIFDKWWKHDVESMVLRDRNHPSIIMWSIGNEIIERTKPEAVETAKMLANTIHAIDSTRPVTSAMTTWNQGWDIFDPLMAAHDVAGYNYQLHYAESDHERVPSRVIVQTESYPKDAFASWNLVQKHNYILGDFVWTAMDYLGESGIGRYVFRVNRRESIGQQIYIRGTVLIAETWI